MTDTPFLYTNSNSKYVFILPAQGLLMCVGPETWLSCSPTILGRIDKVPVNVLREIVADISPRTIGINRFENIKNSLAAHSAADCCQFYDISIYSQRLDQSLRQT